MRATFETLLYAVNGGIATVTLNRPEVRNALSRQGYAELAQAFHDIQADESVRVVVVTGQDPAFCSGEDMRDMRSAEDGLARMRVPRPEPTAAAIPLLECDRPIIAAINGPAVGVGITMTLPMDVRLASSSARMGFVFARRGIVPEAASSWFLPRIVGIAQAMEWVATGRIFGAEEALAGRLVSRVLPPEQLLPAAYALAREIADNTSAVSVALSRQLLWRMLGADHPMEAHRLDSRAIYAMGRSKDAYEGVSSFLEKRPPSFPMRVSRDMPAFFPWWKPRPFGK